MTTEERDAYIESIMTKIFLSQPVTPEEFYDLGCEAHIDMKKLLGEINARIPA